MPRLPSSLTDTKIPWLMAQMTIQQAFELAVKHHMAGQLPEAEKLYRQILATDPRHAGAMHHLGVLANQVGRSDIAVQLIGDAISIHPDFPDAHLNLGNALRALGRLDEAITAYRRAVTLNPASANACNCLGIALREKGQFDESIEAFQQAIAHAPELAEAHCNLGTSLVDKGRPDDAVAALRRAIAVNPNLALAHSNLGSVLKDIGQLDEAVAACRRAIAIQPGYAEAHANLGLALMAQGKLDEAVAAFGQAIAQNPKLDSIHVNLAWALMEAGHVNEAIAAGRQALVRSPHSAEAHSNLGEALRARGDLDEALLMLHKAIALNPGLANAHVNLGVALSNCGQIEQAKIAHRQAVQLDPASAEFGSNLLLLLHYDPDSDAHTIFEEHRLWNRRHALPLAKFIQPHPNDRSPARRLRIGYVSPDFREHVVGWNMLPLLSHHNRDEFEITCYAQVQPADDVTGQIRRLCDSWRNTVGVSDEKLASQIREDGIDILTDLALHTANNRLLVFARKPAPVQVTYLGYCGTTGMDAIDYRLSDPYFDPLDSSLNFYSEQTVRLPRTFWCYQPGPASEPAPSPVLKNKFITFGCLNNVAKVSPATLELWAQILSRLPRSRLLIHAPPCNEIAARLQRLGVNGDRLTLVGKQSRAAYLQTYSQIDIALDPFPFNGGITTCDALWMGVPVVTLSGATTVGRGGRSILSNMGLPELIAFTPKQYVEIAIDLGNDITRLKMLREGMRGRMRASPLMDAARFAKDIESAYRQMWHAWCKTP